MNLQELRTEIDRKYHEACAAMTALEAFLNGGDKPFVQVASQPTPVPLAAPKRSILERHAVRYQTTPGPTRQPRSQVKLPALVEEAIQASTEQFTAASVEAWIKKNYPVQFPHIRARSISTVICRFAKSGKVQRDGKSFPQVYLKRTSGKVEENWRKFREQIGSDSSQPSAVV